MTLVISNVKIKLKFSFFAVTAAMLFCAKQDIVLLCLASSLLHECGHLFFMFIFGEKPERIVLGEFGIRIDRQENVNVSYKKEAVIALGGVAVNAVLCAAFVLLYFTSKREIFLYGVFSNALIAALNLLPIGMLDLGNFLRCVFLMRFDEETTEKRLGILSVVTAVVLTVLFILYTIFISFNLSFAAVDFYVILYLLTEKYGKEKT